MKNNDSTDTESMGDDWDTFVKNLDDPLKKHQVRMYIQLMRDSQTKTRKLIYEIYSRDGFEAVGCKNITDFAKTFDLDRTSLGRQLAAAKVEVNLGVKINTYREGSIRSLAKFSPDIQVSVFKEWKEKYPDQEPTSKQLAEILQSKGHIKSKEPTTADALIKKIEKSILLLPTAKDCKAVVAALRTQFFKVKGQSKKSKAKKTTN